MYLPTGVVQPPLLVWVHGGAWRQGSKASAPLGFVRNGIAVASLDFRLSTEARFPAMVHDIKAAIRFLRAHWTRYGYRGDRMAISGDSSGGHLATLVGVTSGVVELEGTVGDYRALSSAVQAIIDYYGATNLTTILSQSTPFGLGVREPALNLLLGGQPSLMKALAERASPVPAFGPKRSPIADLSWRPRSTDADQPVAQAARRLQEAWPRRRLHRRPRQCSWWPGLL